MTTEQLKRKAMHTAVSYALGQAEFHTVIADMDAVVASARADSQQAIDTLIAEKVALQREHDAQTEKLRRRFQATEDALATVTGGTQPARIPG